MYIDRLSKEEKQKLIKELLETEQSVLYKKSRRVFVICVIGLIYGGFITLYDILNQAGIIHYVLDGILIVFTVFFAYKTYDMKRVVLNKFALEKKNKKKKK